MRKVVIGAMAVLVLGLSALAFYMITQKMDGMKNGFSKGKDDRNEVKEAYLKKVDSLLDELGGAASLAETQCALVEDVWTNVTSKKSSAETDRFTKDENGQFLEDYTEALKRLMNDEFFAARQARLAEDEAAAMKKYNEMTDAPAECQVLHTSLKECCTALSDLTAFTNGSDSSLLFYHSEWTNAKNKFDAAVSIVKFAENNIRSVMNLGNK